MSPVPAHVESLLKVSLCVAPLLAGFYAATELARRRRMRGMARIWSRLAGVCLAAMVAALLAALLVWLIS